MGRNQLPVLLYLDLSSVLGRRQVLFSYKMSILNLASVAKVREIGNFQHELQGADSLAAALCLSVSMTVVLSET